MYKPMILCWLLFISPVLFTRGSESASSEKDADIDDILVAEVKEGSNQTEDEENGVFIPTEDWKVIKKGQHIPPGLHVRMNLETGLKEAKLLDKNDSGELQKSSDQDDDDGGGGPYGKSDRLGAINKRTKVFSIEEVADMLKDINDDGGSVNPESLPRIASSLVSPEDTRTGSNSKERTHLNRKKLPVSLHPDVEVMLQLTTTLANKSSSVSELSEALEELEYYVHRMDNAKDLNAIGGLVLVVRLLNHTHPDVRSWSAHVLGSATQR